MGDRRLGTGGSRNLDVSGGIELLQTETPRLRGRGDTHVYGNTHYRLDPENARPMTAAMLEALARLAPAERAAFDANRRRFLERLDAGLTRWQTAMAPYRGPRVVVAHDSWPSFVRRFGLVVTATVETTPGVPPAPSVLASLPQRMREAQVALLIAEPYSSEATVRQLASRSAVPAVTLAPSVDTDPAARARERERFRLGVPLIGVAVALMVWRHRMYGDVGARWWLTLT